MGCYVFVEIIRYINRCDGASVEEHVGQEWRGQKRVNHDARQDTYMPFIARTTPGINFFQEQLYIPGLTHSGTSSMYSVSWDRDKTQHCAAARLQVLPGPRALTRTHAVRGLDVT